METPTVEHRLDAIFSLTANPAWLTDYVLGDHSVFGTSRPGAVSGWPAITVPFGYVCGLPVGVSFLGPRWSEPRLLGLAYAFEQATRPAVPRGCSRASATLCLTKRMGRIDFWDCICNPTQRMCALCRVPCRSVPRAVPLRGACRGTPHPVARPGWSRSTARPPER